jgi:hypothetical protein
MATKKVSNITSTKKSSAVKGSSNMAAPHGKGSTAKGGANYKKTSNTMGCKAC